MKTKTEAKKKTIKILKGIEEQNDDLTSEEDEDSV